MTKYERLVNQIKQPEARVHALDNNGDAMLVGYIDDEGCIRTGIGGVRPGHFPAFAEWIAGLAGEDKPEIVKTYEKLRAVPDTSYALLPESSDANR